MVAVTNPTQITPPRVDFIDPRTGAISREWYRFFLSLTTSVTTEQSASDNAPDANTLLASYDAMLQSLSDTVSTAPDANSLSASNSADLQSLSKATFSTPRAELGTMSILQQDNVPWLAFSPSPDFVPTKVGSAYWDGGTTLNIVMTPHVTQKIGEDQFYYVKASSAISRGQLVMFTGAVGASGIITGAPASGLTDGQYIVGVAAESIALNGFGLVQSFGTLRNVNTSAFADGDILFYDPTTPGGLTKVQPSAPNVKATIAAVTKGGSAGGGSILIRITVGSVLGGTDSNVQFGTLTDGNIIQYDAANGYWKNISTLNVAHGGTGANSLSSGYLLKGNGTSAISTSIIRDNGTEVGVGAAPISTFRHFIQGIGTSSSTYAQVIRNSASDNLFFIQDDGKMFTGSAANSPYNNTTAAAANCVLGIVAGELLRSTSSIRYKTDVTEYTNGLNEVNKLRPVFYKGVNDGDKVYAGLIAEEVDAAGLKEFVTYDAEGRPDALAYANMIALLIKAVQELSAKLDALTA